MKGIAFLSGLIGALSTSAKLIVHLSLRVEQSETKQPQHFEIAESFGHAPRTLSYLLRRRYANAMTQIILHTHLVTSGMILPAMAQITSDGTTSTTVNQSGNNFTILNGIQRGNNLFHSFGEFSIPTGGEATFNNSSAIENIINRVTSGNISNIDGLIKANGNANLFLINPAGIVFGENVRLDIGGSFLGSTAESILFKDGFEFSAVNPQSTPLLTVSVPLGLQMGSNSGNIQVNGNGHHLTGGLFNPVIRNNTQSTLQVNEGNSIALVGKNITLSGGVLNAENGRIELGGVKSSIVNFDSTSSNFQLNYDNVEQFGDIQLTQQSLLDASGLTSRGIQLQGQNIALKDGSAILIQNTGNETPSNIKVRATGNLELSGDVRIAPDIGNITGVMSSRFMTETLGTGNSADIDVDARNLQLDNGGIFLARTYSPAMGGNITVNVTEDIQINSSAPLNPIIPSGIGTSNLSSGKSGNIKISASNLALTQSGTINTINFGQGDSGNLDVNILGTIELRGIDTQTVTPANIGSTVFREGNGGTLNINTSRLIVEDGAAVTASSLNSGDGGNIIINASEFIEVRNTSPDRELPSRISTSSEISPTVFRQFVGLPDRPSGNAGNLTINTPKLQVDNRGEVAVNNEAVGNGGNLIINTNSLLVDNQSKLIADTVSGEGGNITLQVQDFLQITNGSSINTEALGNGNGGAISIASNNLTLEDNSSINASAVSGAGGNIDLRIGNHLQLSNQSEIVADVLQAGRSGNITIVAPETTLSQASIISNSVFGSATGSELRLTGDRLSIEDGSRLSTLTYGSRKAGNLFIQVGDIEVSGMGNTQVTGFGIVPNPSIIAAGTFPGSSGGGGNLIIQSDRIRITDGGLIATGTLGNGASGNLEIYATESLGVHGVGNLPAPLFGYSTNHPSHISASSFSDAPAGSVNIVTPLFSVTDGALVEVNGAGVGGAGNLEVASDQIFLGNGASLEAEVAGGNQGNISLNSNLLLLRKDSTITTNAKNNANSGNITINAFVVAGFENSDIVANAIEGNGGNIDITTQGIFGLTFREELTPASDITASSQFGVNGTVEIKNFGIDPNSGIVSLPIELSDSSQQVAAGCSSNSGSSSFVATGRGGMPHNPNQSLNLNRTWSDLRDLSTSRNQTNNISEVVSISKKSAIVEATGFMRNENGEIELVALENTPFVTKQVADCGGISS